MIIGESKARASNTCVGCNQNKDISLIVCWGCFKYQCPKHVAPLKYSGLSFEAWQAEFIENKCEPYGV